MSIKGQHFRKGMDVERYQSNPFWEKEKRNMFEELKQGIQELKEEKELTEQKDSAKIPTDKPKGEE